MLGVECIEKNLVHSHEVCDPLSGTYHKCTLATNADLHYNEPLLPIK